MTIGSKIIATLIGSSLFCTLGSAVAEFAAGVASDLIAAGVSLVLT